MDIMDKKEARDRGVGDRLISSFDSFRFAVAEPIMLKIARTKYEDIYRDQTESPLVSICIPTYNRAEILTERAVPSVLKQTYKNFELIIIGDRCTDDTEKLLSRFNDPRIRFYNLPERKRRYPENVENHWLAGPVVPANKALGLVRGGWIARVDDDDIWTPGHIELLLDFARKGNYEFVSGQYIEERFGKRRIDMGVEAQGPYYSLYKSGRRIKRENPKIGGVSTWLYQSYLRFFKYNINCWRKRWNRVNDIDISQRMFRAGVRMGFLGRTVSYVLPRPGEMTVGLEAYRLDEEKKVGHFVFK